MFCVEQRQKIGNLIRVLLEIDVKKEAEMLGVKPNTVYQYELGKFSSAHIDKWYKFYYEKLSIEKMLINVGYFKSSSRWDQYIDIKEDK